MCERLDERGMGKVERGRVHVAQLVRKEKEAGTDSSQGLLPYMPFLSHTHTYRAMCLFAYPSQCWEYGTFFCLGNGVISL